MPRVSGEGKDVGCDDGRNEAMNVLIYTVIMVASIVIVAVGEKGTWS